MGNLILVQLFLIFTLSTVLGADYDENFARYKVWPMASTAYGDQPQLCIGDNFANATFKAQYTVQCDLIKGDSCSAFSAVSHSDQAIILSFRGSISSLQIVDEMIDVILYPPAPFAGGGGVNKYFIDAFNDIWNAGMKNDLSVLKNANPGYELWVTGHSLGAALASVAAATISYLSYVPPEKIKLVTFGQPRIGTTDYAAAVDTLVPYAFRIVHRYDLIPHLPAKGMFNFIHHKSEVWYNNNMTVGSAYTVCKVDEGEGCSDSTSELNLDDHRYYFDVTSDFAENGCPGYNPYR